MLLTCVLIGVISAMTVPGIRKHSERTEMAALAKKGYNTLEQAFDTAIANNEEPVDKWDNISRASSFLRAHIAPYANITNPCNCSPDTVTASTQLMEKSNNCFRGYKEFKKSNNITLDIRSFVTADGIAIAADNTSTPIKFYIDVNSGLNPPNMEGVDVFIFTFGKYKSDCSAIDNNNGDWKFCPQQHAKTLMQNSWKINYW
ncbi:MAG: hypothetical protein LBL18_02085 [Bacteroidales bacterium]|nr:hypothetical protein [Bacteroidales bacterium]